MNVLDKLACKINNLMTDEDYKKRHYGNEVEKKIATEKFETLKQVLGLIDEMKKEQLIK